MTTSVVSNNRQSNTKLDKIEQVGQAVIDAKTAFLGQNSVVEHKGMWLTVAEEQMQVLVVLRFNVCYMYAYLSHD
jgi:hypothetical protein